MKYSADEARSLKAYGELPENTRINETDTYADENAEGVGFEFDEDRSDSEDSDVDVDDI
jgi:translation initiation factor 1A